MSSHSSQSFSSETPSPVSSNEYKSPLSKSFTLDPVTLTALIDYLKQKPLNFFKLPDICTIIAASRLKQVSQSDIQVYESADQRGSSHAIDNTVDYSLIKLQKLSGYTRPHLLVNALQMAGQFRLQADQAKILSLGPRSEVEIMALMSVGAQQQNITAVDLISYTPFIELGDMHDLRFEANRFDVVIAGWVLAYSANPQQAMQEILRVAKPGALVAVGIEVSHPEKAKARQSASQGTDSMEPVIVGTPFHTTADVLALAGDAVDQVIVCSEPFLPNSESVDNIILVFSLKTSDSNRQPPAD